jgi:hypothetical protein
MLSPRLYVEVYGNTVSNFGPSTRKAVIHDALNVGFGWYSRFPANCFFTLRQDSVHNELLTPGLDHVRVWYHDPAVGYGPVLVFAGRLADPNEAGEDVVWEAWSYLAELSLSLTGFRRMYPNKLLGTEIVSPEWSEDSADWPDYGAKVQPDSLLGHVATGTIENPLDLSAVAITTDTRFGVLKVPRLLLFYDLSEMGRANTTNNVTYEISRSVTPTFNFWRNKGSAHTAKRLTFPGTIKDFRFAPGVTDIRNHLSTVGTSLTGQATAIEKSVASGAYGHDLFGLRQDVFSIKTLAGVQSDTEFEAQELITERAVVESTQLASAIRVEVRAQHFQPFDGWDIEDTVRVQIDKGRSVVDADYRIIGIRGMMNRGGYNQSLFLQPPTL